MTGRWLVVAALLLAGCGEASSGSTSVPPARAAYDGPVVRPTAVPGAEGRVTTSSSVLVTDDGSGPWMCWSGNIEFGEAGDPHVCDAARVSGWDWDTVGESVTEEGVRRGWFTLTGTFDGSTFTVEDAAQPDPEPHEWAFEIPCPPPEGGWEVVDPGLVTQDDYLRASSVAQGLDGFALVAVSTPEGEPGPRDPANTVVSVYVAGDPAVAQAAIREVWGGMLCVTRVERSEKEMEAIQRSLLDLPGWTEIGAGTTSNKVEMTVFHDDGRYQQWVDQEFGEGVVVVESILQPVGGQD